MNPTEQLQGIVSTIHESTDHDTLRVCTAQIAQLAQECFYISLIFSIYVSLFQ